MPIIVTPAEIDRWFAYHPSRAGQRERYEVLRSGAYQLAKLIYEYVPPGPDQSAALRKLREAIMTANAGIACEGPTQTAYFERKLARRRVGTRLQEVDEGYTRDPELDPDDESYPDEDDPLINFQERGDEGGEEK